MACGCVRLCVCVCRVGEEVVMMEVVGLNLSRDDGYVMWGGGVGSVVE